MDPALIEKIVQEVIRRLKEEKPDRSAPATLPRKVIVEFDVLDAVKRGEKVIRVLPGTIVTPLARDTLREKGISLEIAGS